MEIDLFSLSGEKIDSFAFYPGGEQAWITYLQGYNRIDSYKAKEAGIADGEYIVWVEFIVHEDGIISDITPLSQVGYGLENAVIKIVEQSGLWEPAIANGKKTASRTKFSFVFYFASG